MDKSDFKKFISPLIMYSGILHIWEFLNRLRKRKILVILMYHRVYDDTVKDNAFFGQPSSTPNNFEKQMRYLSKKCNVISFNELLKIHKEGKKLKKNSVIITFDDGYKDNYDFAYPILKRYNLPATIFLTTGHIGKSELFWWDKVGYIIRKAKAESIKMEGLGTIPLKDRKKAELRIQEKLKTLDDKKKNHLIKKLETELNVKVPKSKELFLSWDEIREMSKNKISFGSHTVTHPILTKLDFESAKKEIIQSKEKIEKELNKKIYVFSYPNGQKEDMSYDIDLFLRKNMILSTVSGIYGANNISRGLFRLYRVGIESDDDFILFRAKLLSMGKSIMQIYLKFLR